MGSRGLEIKLEFFVDIYNILFLYNKEKSLSVLVYWKGLNFTPTCRCCGACVWYTISHSLLDLRWVLPGERGHRTHLPETHLPSPYPSVNSLSNAKINFFMVLYTSFGDTNNSLILCNVHGG